MWKNIYGTSGKYQVSSDGKVRSTPREVYAGHNSTRKVPGRILKSTLRRGYEAVTFSIDGSRKTTSVHRLVAETFIPNPDGLPQVNHKDEDKTNNSVENLEWCTAEYNNNYGTRTQRSVDGQKCRWAERTPAERTAISMKGRETMGPKRRSEAVKKQWDGLSPSERREKASPLWKTHNHEERSIIATERERAKRSKSESLKDKGNERG